MSEAEFLATRPAMEACLQAQPGFQSLRLVREGARWMDFCEWTDLASGQAASVSFMADPDVAAFPATLNTDTMAMHHLEVVAQA